MLTRKLFMKAIDAAKKRKADATVSRAAGMGPNTLSAIRKGRVPSLEHAARIADTVGLELVLRPKGEALSLYALQLSVATALLSGSWGGAAKRAALPIDAVMKWAETLGKMVAGVYEKLEPGFTPAECDDPELHYREMTGALSLYHGLRRTPPTKAEEELGAILLASGLANPTGDRPPSDDAPDQEADE